MDGQRVRRLCPHRGCGDIRGSPGDFYSADRISMLLPRIP